MEGSRVVTAYGNGALTETPKKSSPLSVKVGLAKMLRGGGGVNAEQTRIAEEASVCTVMALERVPSDIRAQGGVARMSDHQYIKEIKQAVTIPVMAKARIGHFVEAQILEAIRFMISHCKLYCLTFKTVIDSEIIDNNDVK